MDRKHAAFFSAFFVGLLGIAVATVGNLRSDLGCTIACASFAILCVAFVAMVVASRMAGTPARKAVSSATAHAFLQDSVIRGAVHRARGLTRARKLVDFNTARPGSDANSLYRPFVGTGRSNEHV